MQVDIKTATVTQIRQTFSHVARHIGGDKPASRYQEATIGMQPMANFHYKPLWDPEHEVFDPRRTKIVMRDWYTFRDPRQYYYGAYTIVRARQQEAMEKNLDFVGRQSLLSALPAEVRGQLEMALVPLRHVEWGANTNNCYITGYGFGTAITQATMFATMDRLGLAQYYSRIGLLLDGNSGDALARGKTLWMEHAAWQGLRRLIEKQFVTPDWFELFVAQNLVLDGLLQPLVLQHYERHIATHHGPALLLLFEFMNSWCEEHTRWVDSTVKTAAAESPTNAAMLAGWCADWQARTVEALRPYVAELFGDQAATVLEKVVSAFGARTAKIGVVEQVQ